MSKIHTYASSAITNNLISEGENMKDARHGFTIVELLIVIVVIAILAAISIVSYTGIQARANDTRMRSAASQLEKAIQTWSVDTGATRIYGGLNSTVPVSSTGCVDGESGWFGSAYICSAEQHLIAQKVITSDFTSSLPRNTYYPATSGGLSFMLYKCTGVPGMYALFWTLQRPTAAESASIDSVISRCGNSQIRDTWGMRAGKIFTLSS